MLLTSCGSAPTTLAASEASGSSLPLILDASSATTSSSTPAILEAEGPVDFRWLVLPADDRFPADTMVDTLSSAGSVFHAGPLAHECPEGRAFEILEHSVQVKVTAETNERTEEYMAGIVGWKERSPGVGFIDHHEPISDAAAVDTCGGDIAELVANSSLVSRAGPNLEGVGASTIVELSDFGQHYQLLIASLGQMTVFALTVEGEVPLTDEELASRLAAAAAGNIELEQRVAYCAGLSLETLESEQLCNYFDFWPRNWAG